VGEVIERLVVVDENQLLLIRIAPQQVQQGGLLAAIADRRPMLRQCLPVGVIGTATGEALDGSSCGSRR